MIRYYDIVYINSKEDGDNKLIVLNKCVSNGSVYYRLKFKATKFLNDMVTVRLKYKSEVEILNPYVVCREKDYFVEYKFYSTKVYKKLVATVSLYRNPNNHSFFIECKNYKDSNRITKKISESQYNKIERSLQQIRRKNLTV